MGGHALKTVETVRLNREDYFRLADEVCNKASGLENYKYSRAIFSKCIVVPSFHLKQSFGDLDCILIWPEDKTSVREYIQFLFQPREIVRNDNIFSFDYQNFQVDFIFTEEKYFNSHIHYLGWEIGNMYGRFAHKMGCKLGQFGLLYPVNIGNYELEVIEISQDWRRIVKFLGFDYDRYLRGFDIAYELYDYLESGLYFNPDIFLLENRNAIARKREIKRVVYMNFLERLKNRSYDKRFIWPENKEYWLEYIDKAFPEVNLIEIKTNLIKAAERIRELKKKFTENLQILIDSGLTGPALGDRISKFKEHLGGKDGFYNFIEKHNKEEIQNALNQMESLG